MTVAGAGAAGRRRQVVRVLLGVAVCLGGWLVWEHRAEHILEKPRAAVERGFRSEAFTAAACVECHKEANAGWEESHHAHANRRLSMARDLPAFWPEKEVDNAGVMERAHLWWGAPVLETPGLSGKHERFAPDMVLAYTPMHQYLMPFPDGGWQVTELAWDVGRGQWFDVYGDEGRKPGEWGHWTGRGMNWNSMCAWCHMTGFSKNYDPAQDRYASRWDGMGVSCTQCHPRMEEHMKNPKAPVAKLSREQIMDNCGTCHVRREEISLAFRAGDSLHDHFRVSLPDQERLWWPDGLQRDEIFVHTPVKLSKMGQAGVTCLDCHQAHSGKLLLPWENNMICQQCHGEPGRLLPSGVRAPVIDPAKHSFHDPAKPGGRCVDCHMPENVYMARDPRRDHAFTMPDPWLAKQTGQPNACNGCHGNRTVEWAAEWTDKWWGDKMKRRERERSLAVQHGYEQAPGAAEELLRMLESEPNDYWRATLLRLLGAQGTEAAGAGDAARKALEDKHPVVRAAGVRALGQMGRLPEVEPMLQDPVRVVRFEAVGVLREQLAREGRLPAEYRESLQAMADQPGGAAMLGQLAFLEGRADEADAWYRRALEGDPYSWLLYYELAVMRNQRQNNAGARQVLERGVEKLPREPELWFALARLLAEENDLPGAERAFRATLERNAGHARAAYNLALLLARTGRMGEALEWLGRAERAAPESPEYPYTRALFLAQTGRAKEARAILEELRRRVPGFAPAGQLLESLPAAD